MREKQGRPPQGYVSNVVQIACRFDPDEFVKLRALATENGISIAAQIRRAVSVATAARAWCEKESGK
jgi:hypothetical protein